MPVWLEAGAIFGGLFVILIAIIAVAVVKFQGNYNNSLVEASKVQGGILQIMQGENRSRPEVSNRVPRREQANGDLHRSVPVEA